MRSRHKAWAKPYLEAHDELVLPRIEAGNPFFQDGPLYLEIGMGKGDFILGLASKQPGHYLGLERDLSVLGVAAKKIIDLPEASSIRLRGEDFDFLYEEELKGLSFDAIYLNFPDPWPKKKHGKRRLTFAPRLANILSLLKPGGRFYFKTDAEALFSFTVEESLPALQGVRLISKTDDYVFDEVGDAMSEYEKRKREMGLPIHRLILEKE